MSEVVLDASAVLALLNAEPGTEAVEGFIPGAVLSSVNFSEVVAKLSERRMPEPAIRAALGDLGLRVASFDEGLAFQSGLLRMSTAQRGSLIFRGLLRWKPVACGCR